MRQDHDEHDARTAGYSLVELLVVVLIVGILVTMAVLSYLRAQDGAKTKTASANLRMALSAAKTMHADEETYLVDGDLASTIAKLAEGEPSLTWQSAAATVPSQISVLSDADTAGFATRSADRLCYYLVDDVSTAGGGTTFGRSTATAVSCASVLDTTTPGITWADNPKAAGW